MKKYQYILLDWDGNLAKTLDVWLAALKGPLVKRGLSFTDAEIGANFANFKERMQSLGVADVDLMLEEASTFVAREVPNVELYPDAITTIEALHQAGKQIALVTTSRHDQIDPLLEKYQLTGFFDKVVCGDDVSNHKPHPEPIQKALELLSAQKNEAVMVGDSGSDIGAANNAGVDSILFFPPQHSKFYDIEELKKLQPTHIIEDFRDIVRIAMQQSFV